MPITRRRFLASAAVAGASRWASGSISRSLAPALFPAPAREPLRQVNYQQVQLTGGPLGEQYDWVHAHYLSLSNERLLKVYRQNAGLAAPGRDMGGWYDLDGFVPGHALGQFVSGLARMGATTGDAACHEKVRELVTGFAETLGPKNKSILRPETNLWICYTLDKHFAGLIDAATLSEMPEARALLNRVLEGAEPLLPAKGRDRIGKKKPPYDETYVMPENLFTAAMLTNNPAFEELAQRYMLDRELFDPLARGENPFPGQHAYSHAIALSSAGMAYLQHGDAKYRESMQQAFLLLTTQQQFASGGWGPNETFIEPHKGELFAALRTTQDHFETPCGSYAATKLARYLLRTTAGPQDTRHGDNLERVLFNTILVTRRPDSDGDYFYYSTYSDDATKVYYPKRWPCCSGTLVQTVADYPLNCYFDAGEDGLYVNLYTPSVLRLNHRDVPFRVQQETRFPTEDTVRFTIEAPPMVEVPLHFRIPAWVEGQASLEINGRQHATASAGTWLRVRRRWRPEDKVALTLPQGFRFEAIDEQHPETVALMRGPVQYVALNARAGFPAVAAPSSLRPAGHEIYTEEVAGVTLTFVPLYRVANETYTSYFHRG